MVKSWKRVWLLVAVVLAFVAPLFAQGEFRARKIVSDSSLELQAGGTDQNITLTPSGLGGVVVNEPSGPGEFFYAGPPKASFLPGIQTFPNFSDYGNSVTSLNNGQLNPYHFASGLQVLVQDNTTAEMFGLYAAAVDTHASGERPGMIYDTGIRGDVYTHPTMSGTVPKMIGVSSYTEHNGSGTVGDMIGFYAYRNLNDWATGPGPTNNYSFYAEDQDRSDGSAYGFYTEQGARTNSWAFYAAGGASSYFGGNVGIGTIGPHALLEVAGATNPTFLLSDGGGDTRKELYLVYRTSEDYAELGSYQEGGGGAKKLALNPLGGNVGVGKAPAANAQLDVAKSIVSGLNTVAFSATPTFDASLGNTQKITLGGNVTSSTLSNATAGEQINFLICQDGAGNRTFVWPTNVLGAMTISSTASKCSAQTFIFDGTNAYALSLGVTNM